MKNLILYSTIFLSVSNVLFAAHVNDYMKEYKSSLDHNHTLLEPECLCTAMRISEDKGFFNRFHAALNANTILMAAVIASSQHNNDIHIKNIFNLIDSENKQLKKRAKKYTIDFELTNNQGQNVFDVAKNIGLAGTSLDVLRNEAIKQIGQAKFLELFNKSQLPVPDKLFILPDYQGVLDENDEAEAKQAIATSTTSKKRKEISVALQPKKKAKQAVQPLNNPHLKEEEEVLVVEAPVHINLLNLSKHPKAPIDLTKSARLLKVPEETKETVEAAPNIRVKNIPYEKSHALDGEDSVSFSDDRRCIALADGIGGYAYKRERDFLNNKIRREANLVKTAHFAKKLTEEVCEAFEQLKNDKDFNADHISVYKIAKQSVNKTIKYMTNNHKNTFWGSTLSFGFFYENTFNYFQIGDSLLGIFDGKNLIITTGNYYKDKKNAPLHFSYAWADGKNPFRNHKDKFFDNSVFMENYRDLNLRAQNHVFWENFLYTKYKANKQTKFILASDGLWDNLTKKEIEDLLLAHKDDGSDLAEILANAAKQTKRKPDDITVAVFGL